MLSENFFHLWQDHFTLGRIDMPDLESRSRRRSHARLVDFLNRSCVTLFCLPAIQSLIKNMGGNSTEWFASALKRYTRPIDTEVYEASKPSNSLIRSSSTDMSFGINEMMEYNDNFTVVTKGKEQLYTGEIICMVNLDLSCNNLTGEVPEEICTLAALKFLEFLEKFLEKSVTWHN